MPAAIRFSEATKTFTSRSGTVNAVRDVSFEITDGEIFGVIGHSGAGKSTLVRLVNGLEKATSGTVDVLGHQVSGMSERSLRAVRPHIGMIFQQFNLFGSKTVADNVGYPLRLAGWTKQERRARVTQMLEFVGLGDKAKSYPSQLSGGQKQRVGIARALAPRPRVLLADESTSALDPETTRDVLALLRRINSELGLTILLITHEMDVVKYLCHRVAVMENGAVVEEGPVYDIFANPRHDTTQRFVATSLRDKPTDDVLQAIAAGHPGARLVTVAVREEKSSSSAITQILAEHQVTAGLVYGGITDVGVRPIGSLTYALTGDRLVVDQTIAALATVTAVEVHDEIAASHSPGDGSTAADFREEPS